MVTAVISDAVYLLDVFIFMADNETLVSWRFEIDKFSDHLCEWVCMIRTIWT